MKISDFDTNPSLTNRPRSESSAHWYTRAGEPMYTIIGKNGKERNTTLADARKLLLPPSVTGIIACQHREGLSLYKAEQLLLSGLTLPRGELEPEREWLRRVWEDSREHSRQSAETGVIAHHALQLATEGKEYDPAWHLHVTGALQAIKERFPQADKWQAEVSGAHPLGFGGKTDLVFDDGNKGGVIIDFKSKQSFSGKLKLYDEHYQQLAAYSMMLNLPYAECAICFVSIDEPGRTQIIVAEKPDLDRGWDMFRALLAYWQAKNKYNSSWT